MLSCKQGNTERGRKIPATKQLGARVPVQLWERLRKTAFARKESMSKFVTRNLEEALSSKSKS